MQPGSQTQWMKNSILWFIDWAGLWGLYIKLYGYWTKRRTRKPWILGRVACLGLDTYQLLNNRLPLYNIQKGRVDYLYMINTIKPAATTAADRVMKYIIRDDIKALILQQAFADFSFATAPQMLYMDSYSELTDQLFVSKNSPASFCCNYTDLSNEFTNEYTALGLLPENEFIEHYRVFFSFIRQKYGSIDIIFIHFPCKLETRETFVKRHHLIKEAINIVHTLFPPFYIHEVPDNIVAHAAGDDFPYHFSANTYLYLKEVIEKLHFRN